MRLPKNKLFLAHMATLSHLCEITADEFGDLYVQYRQKPDLKDKLRWSSLSVHLKLWPELLELKEWMAISELLDSMCAVYLDNSDFTSWDSLRTLQGTIEGIVSVMQCTKNTTQIVIDSPLWPAHHEFEAKYN